MESKEQPPTLLNIRFINYITEQIRLHGMTIVLLAVAVWYFEGQNKVLREEIRDCNQSLIAEYKVDRAQTLQIISNNTAALNQIRAINSTLLNLQE